MKTWVLDSSAVMAYFENRPGADAVERLFDASSDIDRRLLMSAVNWGEVYYSVWHTQGKLRADDLLLMLHRLPVEIVEATKAQAEQAAALRAEHGLPYADAFAAVLALQSDATLVTSDKDFARVEKKIRILWVGPHP